MIKRTTWSGHRPIPLEYTFRKTLWDQLRLRYSAICLRLQSTAFCERHELGIPSSSTTILPFCRFSRAFSYTCTYQHASCIYVYDLATLCLFDVSYGVQCTPTNVLHLLPCLGAEYQVTTQCAPGLVVAGTMRICVGGDRKTAWTLIDSFGKSTVFEADKRALVQAWIRTLHPSAPWNCRFQSTACQSLPCRPSAS
jgi:hypothetical protein